jgi:hypothetical protein
MGKSAVLFGMMKKSGTTCLFFESLPGIVKNYNFGTCDLPFAASSFIIWKNHRDYHISGDHCFSPLNLDLPDSNRALTISFGLPSLATKFTTAFFVKKLWMNIADYTKITNKFP